MSSQLRCIIVISAACLWNLCVAPLPSAGPSSEQRQEPLDDLERQFPFWTLKGSDQGLVIHLRQRQKILKDFERQGAQNDDVWIKQLRDTGNLKRVHRRVATHPERHPRQPNKDFRLLVSTAYARLEGEWTRHEAGSLTDKPRRGQYQTGDYKAMHKRTMSVLEQREKDLREFRGEGEVGREQRRRSMNVVRDQIKYHESRAKSSQSEEARAHHNGVALRYRMLRDGWHEKLIEMHKEMHKKKHEAQRLRVVPQVKDQTRVQGQDMPAKWTLAVSISLQCCSLVSEIYAHRKGQALY